MDPGLRSSRAQFKKSIPPRSKHRLSIFVWVCWQWHRQMRENKMNVKNKLEFASWNEPHSLPRRLAIALRDREANPSDISNYNDPFIRLGDRYRAYWQHHSEIHGKVFSNNEPGLDIPIDYVKPVFSFRNSLPTYENTKDDTSFNSSELDRETSSENHASSEHFQRERPDRAGNAQNATCNLSVNGRPKPPSSYIESPELVALLNHIHTRNHAICLSMVVDCLKYGKLRRMQNDRERLHEIMIHAGFSCEFISHHGDYMEYFINNLHFIHAELWETIYSGIDQLQNLNQSNPASNINTISLNSCSPRSRGEYKLYENHC